MNRHESMHTTHFSIIDADGNMAAVTQTVNLPFGNGMVVAGTGFLLNNEMDDFALKAGTANAFGLVGNDANAPKAGHRPLSSMTPSFVIGKDRLAVIGTPGGSRASSRWCSKAFLPLSTANCRSRSSPIHAIHHQYLPDVISAEPHAFSPDEVRALEKMGYIVNEGERTWGFMNMVSWDRKSGKMYAGSDPRGTSGSGEVK